MTTTSVAVLVLLIAVVLRSVPHLLASGHSGVDHWFWKSYIETYRRHRVFPPQLPQYLLDENQWYPPLFPLLLARLPGVIFDRYTRWIATAIDIARLVLLFAILIATGHGNPATIAIAGMAYATTPILVSYNTQLNPRGLAALFLDALVALALWDGSAHAPLAAWVAAVALGALILLTHKMTTQLMCVICIGAGVLFDVRMMFLIPASMAVAMLISKGFYVKVLRAHWDIATFWHRNSRWLQVDPIRESPVYGEPGYQSPGRFYLPGIRGLRRHARYLVGYCPGIWMLLAALAVGVFVPAGADGLEVRLIWVVAIVAAFALGTILVPVLRCFGSGYLYLYNAALPTAALWGIALERGAGGMTLRVAYVAVIGASVILIVMFFQRTRSRATAGPAEDLQHALDFLRTAPSGAIMCIPAQLYDVVAYRTGQPVLYGGHGYGFKKLEPTFPRLTLPLPDLCSRYGLSYVLVVDDNLPRLFAAELTRASLTRFGSCRVFSLRSMTDRVVTREITAGVERVDRAAFPTMP